MSACPWTLSASAIEVLTPFPPFGQPSLFTAESTRFCAACSVDIRIGFGGEANWDTHTNSAAHIKAEKSASNQPSLSKFFSKSTPINGPSASTSRASTSTLPAALPNNASRDSLPDVCSLSIKPSTNSVSSHEVIDVDDPIIDLTSYASPFQSIEHEDPLASGADTIPPPSQEHPSLLVQLRAASRSLPPSVPLGTIDELLAQFSSDPTFEVAEIDPDERWEYINKATDRVFGYGMSAQDLAPIIRRGIYGMDGVCTWLEICVNSLGIELVLLEGRIERMLEAMKALCVIYYCLLTFKIDAYIRGSSVSIPPSSIPIISNKWAS